MDWRNIAIIFVNCLVVGLGYYLGKKYLGNALLGVIAAFLFVALVFCILLFIEIF